MKWGRAILVPDHQRKKVEDVSPELLHGYKDEEIKVSFASNSAYGNFSVEF